MLQSKKSRSALRKASSSSSSFSLPFLSLSLILWWSCSSASGAASGGSIPAVLHTVGAVHTYCVACDGTSKAPPKAPHQQPALSLLFSSKATPPPLSALTTSTSSSATNETFFPIVDVASEPTAGGCRASSAGGFEPWLSNSTSVGGAAVVFRRGNCTFKAMADVASGRGALGVFVANNGSNASLTPYAQRALVPVCGLGEADAAEVAVLAAAGEMFAIFATDTGHSMPLGSAAALILMATFCAVVGSICASAEDRYRAYRPGSGAPLLGRNRAEEGEGEEEEEDEVPELTMRIVLFFLVFASAFLVLMYFFSSKLTYLFVAVFVLFTGIGMYNVIITVLPEDCFKVQICIPYCKQTPAVAVYGIRLVMISFSNLEGMCGGSALSVIMAGAKAARMCQLEDALHPYCFETGLGVFWAVQRASSYAWIIQNILSVAFLVTATSSLKVPNLKLITVFLAALLVYDVFFVFITPFLTKDGSSIMVRAAMGKPGSDGCSSEGLPFLIRIPRAPVECACPSDMALGYGDVVLPSLLVAFAMRWDYYMIWASDRSKQRPSRRNAPFVTRHGYGLAASVAYFAGLVAAFVALQLSEMAQPALLYLSPCTCGTMWLLAYCRGDLAKMLQGFPDGSSSRIRRNGNGAGADGSNRDGDASDDSDSGGDEADRPLLLDEEATVQRPGGMLSVST